MADVPPNPHVRECPYCGVRSQFNLAWTQETNARVDPHDEESPHELTVVAVYWCVNCGGAFFARAWRKRDVLETYPQVVPEIATQIPVPVSGIFREALVCFSAGAWNATAVMCRRTIQEAVLDLKAEGESLFQQIECLAKKQVIAPALVNYAHEVRLIGRDGAHADVPTDITRLDASDAVEFTSEFLNYVYVLMGRLVTRRTRREEQPPKQV